jgi:hypothetical protein
MFGFLPAVDAAGLDCVVWAIEFSTEPVKKIAAMNAAQIVKTEFVIFVSISDSSFIDRAHFSLKKRNEEMATMGKIISYHAPGSIRLTAYSTGSLG